VDTWLKLHVHLIAVILGSNRTSEGCKKKFNTLYKLYKKEKLANGILGSDCHACKFYDYFDQWWHQTGTIIKHVTTSAYDFVRMEDSTIDNENDLHLKDTSFSTIMTTPNSTIKIDKRNFQERCYGVFVQMAENSSIMVNFFEKTNTLLERVDR
jgi:hypothetical protein